MDIRSLQCFVAVAESLSFSKAAQRLFISQPTLSIRISSLEDELGAELFCRTHQQVYLTSAGAALLPAAREILEKISNLHFIVRNLQEDEHSPRKLRIGIDSTEDRSIPTITDVFTRFRQNYPDVDMEVSDLTLDDYEEKLLKNDLDFGLMVLQDNMQINPLFLTIPILKEPMVMVATDAEGESVADLIRTRDVQLLHEGTKSLRWNEQYLEFLARYLPNVQPTYVEGITTLRMNLMYGDVLTFLPLTYVQNLGFPRISVIPVDLANSNITLTLVWNKLNINPAIQLLINEFNSEIQQEQDTNYEL